jgi:plastocyanin
LLLLGCLALAAAVAPLDARAQGVTDRPPNFGGTWTGNPGVLHFHFLHRFTVGDAPTRKVANGPTFLLAASLPAHLLLGTRYATNSQVAAAYPNEWEFFGRINPIAEERGAPLDAAVHAGYNLAAESFDVELALARAFGPLRLQGVGRWFSAAFDGDSSRLALGAGATLRLNNTFSLAGDYTALLDASDAEDAAWGAAIQIAIPYTPHSLSLQVTNTNSATLQGSSIDSGDRRYGFEFTIPITLSRYFGSRGATDQQQPAATPPGAPAAAPAGAAGDTVRVVIRNNAFQTAQLTVSPGTTVLWVNEDQLQHTVTADDNSYDSGMIDLRGTWAHTFGQAGTFTYHCTPHPFMKGTVVVR